MKYISDWIQNKSILARRVLRMKAWIKNQIKQFKEPFPEPGSLKYNLQGMIYDLQILSDKLLKKEIKSEEENERGDENG